MVPEPNDHVHDPRIPATSIRRVELELKKTRLQAEIARLEIREVELALWLDRAKAGEWGDISSDSLPCLHEGTARIQEDRWQPFALAAWQRLAEIPWELPVRPQVPIYDPGSIETPSLSINNCETSNESELPETFEAVVSSIVESGKSDSSSDPQSLATLPIPKLKTPEHNAPTLQSQKKRIGGAALSAAVHAIVLLVLGLWSFQSQEPRDVLALSASTADDNPSETLESFQIEAAAAPQATPEDAITETVAEIDPLGDMPAVNLQSVMAEAPSPTNSLAELLQSSSNVASSLSTLTSPNSSTVFCGVSSEGTRLCFLVDSSKSMSKGRFEAARSELLNTIDSLPSDKRFYVFFYSTVVAPMHLTSTEPEEYLAFASPENKRAVRTWAMTVEMDRGAPPDNALKMAFDLKPEVIFLLTDGEFSERTEALLADLNRKDSLFGETGRNCIIHTIAFHSRTGIERLERIAKAHGGRFKYVEPPK